MSVGEALLDFWHLEIPLTTMNTQREQSKAAQYIQRLDEARCEGNWDAVPELVRKIKKHAPHRTCLILTAESEYTVIQTVLTKPSTARSASANSNASAGHTAHTETTATAFYSQYPSISRNIPLLLEAIENEKTYVEDEFQAQVCLGWIHWQLGEPSLAASRLPRSVEQDYAQLDGTNKESAEWTKVCALKASYIKGSVQGRMGAVDDALESYESALPILTRVPVTVQQPKELRTWTELYLTGFCVLSSQAIKSKLSSILETETLSAFRAWARFWEVQGPSPTGGRAPQAEVYRRQVWKEYYITLSDVLQQDLPFPTTALTTAYTSISTRLQQRAELKKIEARYETLLLAEVQFPKAEEASDEVEAFVDLVMQNWRKLCGSSWSEQDLGEGGAEAVSRGVLDILYRAATKTFHSTTILRHLFTVHLAIADFDLAFKAFDTYMEIVKKGKARVEKTGEEEHGLDDDETVLRTASECIKALCRYGSRQGAEKGKDLGQFFEDWLDKHHPIVHSNANGRLLENGRSGEMETIVSPKTFALAWRCIGIAHAQWARLTYDAPSRSDIQLRAIKCFRKALLPQYESTNDVETLFALGIILAERRELAAAIEIVKSGLLPRSNIATGAGPHPGRFSRERSLVPLWHLMSLLLSARQDFLTAARACEGAFEQFQDPKNLFGEADVNGVYRSDHLNEKSKGRSQGGVVDDMDDFERESVLEVKMTQLALIEVLEGPEVAVNASDELLSLYTRLFVDSKTDAASSAKKTTLAVPPKSSAGTIKSITGSIFGRSGRSVRKSATAGSIMSEKALVARPKTTQTIASTRAPTIQVTSDNGIAAKQHHHEKLQKRSDSVSRSKDHGSARERSTSTSRRRSDSGARSHESHNATTVDGEKFFTPPADVSDRNPWQSETVKSPTNLTPTKSSPNSHPGSRPSAPKSQQMTQKDPSLKPANQTATIAHDNRLPHISTSSSLANPLTRFPKDQQRRRRIAILVQVWLLVSGFYRRASLYDDAKGGIEEAHKLVKSLEEDVSRDTSGHVSITYPGWGGGKSVAELWGDVFSERGYLAVAETSPYAALGNFESALSHFADHPSAIVGLSNILLDIYSEELLPPPSIPSLVLPSSLSTPSSSTVNTSVPATPLTTQSPPIKPSSSLPIIPHGPIGLASTKPRPNGAGHTPQEPTSTPESQTSGLEPSYKGSSASLLDRLAARDRAYGLLTALTKLGTGWNYSEAWFALARAYEEGGQPDKAREVLWWCVELEEGRGVRDWNVVGSGGYVL